MKLVILKRPIEILESDECRTFFMDLIALRQRLYREQFEKALCMDKFDLISDHYILYDNTTNTAIGYMRSVSKKICQEYKTQVPLFDSVRNSDEHLSYLQDFLNEVKHPLNMSFLCKDSKFNHEIKQLKICNLMIWLAFKDSGVPLNELGYCATPNCKYNLKASLKDIGSFYANLRHFIHPTIPETHELIMINNISLEFWQKCELKYRSIYENRLEISLNEMSKKAAA